MPGVNLGPATLFQTVGGGGSSGSQYSGTSNGMTQEYLQSIDQAYRAKFGQGMPGDVFDQLKKDRGMADAFTKALSSNQNDLLSQANSDPQLAKKYQNWGLINQSDLMKYQNDITAAQTKADNQAAADKLTTDTANNAYKPSQDILDVEKEFKNIMANPTTLDPAKVQSWQDWINKNNTTNDAAATTRLNAQFSALGDLGSSANRQALAQNDATTQLARSGQAQGLAAQDLNSAWTQKTAALNGLMQTGSYQDQLRLIPLQQQWQNYLANQNQGFTNQNLATQNQYQVANTYLQSDLANKNTQNLLNLYNQTKPQTNWWDPIVNAGLTGVGYALGGPAGGAIGSGIGGLFSSSGTSAGAYNSGNSLLNSSSKMNLPGYSKP